MSVTIDEKYERKFRLKLAGEAIRDLESKLAVMEDIGIANHGERADVHMAQIHLAKAAELLERVTGDDPRPLNERQELTRMLQLSIQSVRNRRICTAIGSESLNAKRADAVNVSSFPKSSTL